MKSTKPEDIAVQRLSLLKKLTTITPTDDIEDKEGLKVLIINGHVENAFGYSFLTPQGIRTCILFGVIAPKVH
jgi:hypothetical protein